VVIPGRPLIVCAIVALAGQTPPSPRIARLERWLAAVERHQPGTADGPAIEIGSWPASDLRTLRIDLSSLAESMRNPKATAFYFTSRDRRTGAPIRYTAAEIRRLSDLARDVRDTVLHPDENDVMKRGALLHADIAMLVPRKSEPLATRPPPGPRQFVMNTADGRQLNLEDAAEHWEIGRALLDKVTPNPSQDGMVRLWYRATAAYMQSREQLDLAHLEQARHLFPDDAGLLFISGCLHETFAAPRVQAAVRSAVLPRWMAFDVSSEHAELQQAEFFFRSALDADPRLAEARVRLGRVYGLQGRHADSAGELRQAVADTKDPLLLYYAALFLGAEEEALEHRDAARTAYERAAAIYPRAQSPYLALSQLARRVGDRPAALQAIQKVLKLPAGDGDRDDPWWTYHLMQGRNTDALLAELRGPFLAAHPRPREIR